MKHTYIVTGMTCGGCKAGVEKALGKVPGVTQVDVSLEKEEASIEMHKHIDIATLRDALPVKYAITPKEERNVFQSAQVVEEESKWKQLFPLFLILGYISLASIAMHYDSWSTEQAMLDFMGLFYVVFSFFKLLDLKGFKESFAMYDPLAKGIPAYGWVYPFIEAGLGLMFLFRFQVTYALVATLLVLGITTIGVTRTLLSKNTIQCACLGTALKLPMTEATFVENAVMIVMAITMLANLV